jgi:predicted NAD/FAD-binding protein
MNKLQNLETSTDYFVTLNAEGDIKPESILYETVYTHPIYTPQSPVSQRAIRALNGTRHTYFCGAYMRYGFHEDAVQSALDVTRAFGSLQRAALINSVRHGRALASNPSAAHVLISDGHIAARC